MQDIEDLEMLYPSLRVAAGREDSASVRHVELAGVWQCLMQGELTIADCFTSHGRELLVLRAVPRPPNATSIARKLELLERVMLASGQKVTAMELRLSASTISSGARQALNALGLSCTPSRVPLVLVALAHASRQRSRIGYGRVSNVAHEGQTYLTVSIAYPALERYGLSLGERDVTRLVLCGRSHDEIASHRATSRRTVANQLASAFKRIGVSGRAQLMQRLLVTPVEDPTMSYSPSSEPRATPPSPA